MALWVFSDLPIWRLALPGSDTPPAPLRLAPQGAKITTLLASGPGQTLRCAQGWETFDRSVVSNTQSGQRLGHTVRRRAQPSSASKPQFLLRRWGRKADRVRLGQRTLVG